MRNKAYHLGAHEDVKTLNCATLDAAERRLNRGRSYRKDKLQATESVFLLDGLLKLGEANVIIGQPKVGKSSFSTGLIAAIRERREQFLGRDLLLPKRQDAHPDLRQTKVKVTALPAAAGGHCRRRPRFGR